MVITLGRDWNYWYSEYKDQKEQIDPNPAKHFIDVQKVLEDNWPKKFSINTICFEDEFRKGEDDIK